MWVGQYSGNTKASSSATCYSHLSKESLIFPPWLCVLQISHSPMVYSTCSVHSSVGGCGQLNGLAIPPRVGNTPQCLIVLNGSISNVGNETMGEKKSFHAMCRGYTRCKQINVFICIRTAHCLFLLLH